MKGKKLVPTTLIALLILSVAIVTVSASITNPPPFGTSPTIWVDDSAAHFSTTADLTGTKFNVTVNIWNVTFGLGAYEFKMSFNNSLLNATGCALGVAAANISGLPKPQIGGVWKPINNTAGTVWVGVVITYGSEFYGNGSLAIVEFEIIYAPPQLLVDNKVECALDIFYSEITDKDGTIIPNGESDGLYQYIRKAKVIGAPTADFTWSPTTIVPCTDVTLTDTSDVGEGATAIVSWKWTIANGTGSATLTGPDDTSVTTFHCDGVGTVFVTLNVTNDVGKSDDVTKTITQLPAGALIDLYTSDNRFCGQTTPYVGLGQDEPCDALTDDVNVTLYAEVTWRLAPVMHVLVAFEVWWNYSINWQRQDLAPVFMNQCVLYRTAETDKNGIAEIWFRVPTPCPERMHGKWVALVKAKVQEVTIQDTMPFDVGWLITLTEVPALTTDKTEYVRDNPPSHGPDCISFNVTVKNIAWIPKELTLIAVIYDDCDVPIGQYIINTVIPPTEYGAQWYNHTVYETTITVTCHLPVPQWAYVGIGKLYVSAFTRLPRDCGVAYCPEVSTTFTIQYVP